MTDMELKEKYSDETLHSQGVAYLMYGKEKEDD